MTRQIGSIVSAAFTALLVAFGGAILTHRPASAADDCLAAPKSPTPPGGHWYYRTDRAKQRKCWFLGQQKQTVHAAAPQAAPAAAPVAASLVPSRAQPTDGTVTKPALVRRPAPQSSPAAAPLDAWDMGTNALQKQDPLTATDIFAAPTPSAPTAQVPPATSSRDQETDIRTTVQVEPLAATEQQMPARAAVTPVLVLLFIAGVLAMVVFVLRAVFKNSASARRQPFAIRHRAERNHTRAPQLVPSIFDIKDVPPLPPMARAEPAADIGKFLRKLLRDVEGNAVRKTLAR